MALRSIGVSRPPPVSDPRLQSWMQDVTNALGGLPISIFSTSDGPNTSVVTATVPTLGLEIGSSSTKLWVKTGVSSSTGWTDVV